MTTYYIILLVGDSELIALSGLWLPLHTSTQ